MTFGDLLAQLAEHAYDLWPLRVIQEWEQGVLVSGGHVRRTLTHDNGLFGKGLHAFVPVWQSVERRDANEEVVELDWQTVRLPSGEEVTFSLSAKYRIRDLAMLYRKIQSPSSSISEAIRSGAGTAALAFPDAGEMVIGLADAARAKGREQMRGWGVDLISVNLISLTGATPLRLIMDPIGAAVEDER